MYVKNVQIPVFTYGAQLIQQQQLCKNHIKIRLYLYATCMFVQLLNILYKTNKTHVCLLNRKHIVDHHALRLIRWIGESA